MINMNTLIIYRLDKYKFYAHDIEDGEDDEERFVLGYFNSRNKLEEAIETCISHGIKRNELDIHKFGLICSQRRKFIYELSFGYTLLMPEGRFTDYAYVFPPQLSKQDCVKLKLELKKESKYQGGENKVFDFSPDGFWIERFKLNELYNVIPKT